MTKPALTRAQEEFLAYLQHDKNHMLSPNTRHPMLDDVIASHKELCTVTLYRGCSKAEYDRMRTGAPVNNYQSFTTNIHLAKSCAKGVDRLMVTVEAVVAYDYGSSMVAMFKSMPAAEYESSDGDFMIQSLKTEAEWIVPFGSCYKPLIGRQRFSMI